MMVSLSCKLSSLTFLIRPEYLHFTSYLFLLIYFLAVSYSAATSRSTPHSPHSITLQTILMTFLLLSGEIMIFGISTA
ncbi:hypothetical protein VTO42DRAFT_5203 [Malbranchea cinnamomea]